MATAGIVTTEALACPACGGAGGGPFGRGGGAWDVDDYVCPRCEGMGLVLAPRRASVPPSASPGIVKTTRPSVVPGQEKKKRALGD
jgi:hypothetical protein